MTDPNENVVKTELEPDELVPLPPEPEPEEAPQERAPLEQPELLPTTEENP